MTEPSMACAVCGFIVNERVYIDGQTTWIHSNSPDDHPVMAVPYTAVNANVRCDFCLADHAGWTLPVEDYQLPTGDFNRGNWAACDDCAALVQKDKWNKLIDRAQKAFEARHGPASRMQFTLVYALLRPHILGPIARHES